MSSINYSLLYLALCAVSLVHTAPSPSDQTRAWDQEIFTEQRGSMKMVTSEVFDHVNSHDQDNLPEGIRGEVEHSNLCQAIYIFNGRLFVGWRSAPMHFASSKTKMFIMSAPVDDMANIQANQTFAWETEKVIQLGTDAREPYFFELNGTLHFQFFKAGTNPIAFQPNTMWHFTYLGATGQWSEMTPWGKVGEVAWQYNVENNTAYVSSYLGSFNPFHLGSNQLRINKSVDGVNWSPADDAFPVSYIGGVSETGWSFDLKGDFWGVLRNELGDKSGWGSRVAHAEAGKTGEWTFKSSKSNPNIHESPRMFRHGDDLYLIARTDPSGKFMNNEFWQWPLPAWLHHLTDLAWFSLRNHGNGIWKLNKETHELEQIATIPGCGDTSFASIVRLSKHKYLISNYSSPRKWCKDWAWIHGQIDPEGSAIYFMTLEFQEDGEIAFIE